jgi:hypothetical protein
MYNENKYISEIINMGEKIMTLVVRKPKGLLVQPKGYYIFFLSCLVIGILSFLLPDEYYSWLSGATSRNIRWRLFVGEFLVYFSLSQFAMQLLVSYTDKLVNLEGIVYINSEEKWGPILVGIIESILYPLSIIIRKSEFIGFWLALKVAGNWIGWGTDRYYSIETSSEETIKENGMPESSRQGRRVFNKFLFGSGLRVILAFIVIIIMRISGALY